MPVAGSKTLPFESIEKIDPTGLERFSYEGPKQNIVYKTREFSAVCPFSGLPDIADVEIEYIPSRYCVELKSLKFYFLSYRNVGIYQEAVTARIYQDLHKLLEANFLRVKTVYNIRGGIDSTCEVRSDRQ